MLDLVVGILNGGVWFFWYMFSPEGWAVESTAVRTETFLIILVGSAIGVIGSIFWRNFDNSGPIANAWRILEFAAFFGAPFMNLFLGEADIFGKVLGFVTCAFTFFCSINVKFSEKPLFIRFCSEMVLLFINAPFLFNTISFDEIVGPAVGIAFFQSIILGIKNSIFN